MLLGRLYSTYQAYRETAETRLRSREIVPQSGRQDLPVVRGRVMNEMESGVSLRDVTDLSL